jgi:hypothetical protein
MEVKDTPSYEETLTLEEISMAHFAGRLSSCNFTNVPSIGDDKSTRKEATLLMSLSATTPRLDSSDSFFSCVDDSDRSLLISSESSRSKRPSFFRFTCPSLSLEQGHTQLHLKGTKRPAIPLHNESTSPATLLGRPLSVDDADALRLSADAMARNLLQSYQKALDWRMDAWTRALAAVLMARYERAHDGTQTALLLDSREARLIRTLREVEITAMGSGTAFRVLLLSQRGGDGEEPAPKKRRRLLLEDGRQDNHETGHDEAYTVERPLVLDCVIHCQTPAGLAEISLAVPGTMEGIFWQGGEMKSCVVHLDTNMLSAMIEKSCRIVVRASVECIMEGQATVVNEQAVVDAHTSISDEEEATTDLTPAPLAFSSSNEDLAAAAVVTPRRIRYSDNPLHALDDAALLLTIPEDLDDSINPRRISPQPGSPALGTSSSLFTPTTPRRMPRNKGVPLISPPADEYPEFHEVSGSTPSLPVLVEVACRAMRSS